MLNARSYMVDVGKPAAHHDEDKSARPRARGPVPLEAPGPEADPVSHRLFELLPDSVMMLDGDGVVRYVNPAGVQLVGAGSAGDVLGRSVWIFVHPDDDSLVSRWRAAPWRGHTRQPWPRERPSSAAPTTGSCGR